jgi:hypothetical protein
MKTFETLDENFKLTHKLFRSNTPFSKRKVSNNLFITNCKIKYFTVFLAINSTINQIRCVEIPLHFS